MRATSLRPGRGRFAILAALALLGGGGCRGAKLYPVTGAVQFAAGRPATELAGGSVSFESADGTRSARGTIQPDGSFRLGTHKDGDGAAPGEYRVVVVPYVTYADYRPSPIPHRYSSYETSGLTALVKPGENHFVFTLERVKP